MYYIAHRFGNDMAQLQRAGASLVDRIEVDVHLDANQQPQARHAKRLWFTSRYWEKWRLLPAETSFPPLADILDAAPESTHMWLDLKGYTRRLSRRALAKLEPNQPLTVSSKAWWILKPFQSRANTTIIRSAGNRLELWLLLWLPSKGRFDGVVVHHRLLNNRLAAKLLSRGELYTWPVDSVGAADKLCRLGVTGVIVDDLSIVDAHRNAGS